MRDEGHVVDGVVVHVTDKAVGLMLGDAVPGDEPVWIPKSQIEDYDDMHEPDVGEEVEFIIPLWLAEAKGLA